MKALPRINAAYWLVLMCASVFGTNTGDFVSDYLHIGHLTGLPFLAVAFVLVLLAERFSPKGSALFFWTAIIVVRTAATNIGDAFHDFDIGFNVSLPLTVALFAVCIAIYKLTVKSATPDGVVRVSPLYWLCMIMAGIVGTIGGDFASFGLHLMPAGTFAVFGLVVLALLLIGRKGQFTQPIYYWICLGFIRTSGTGGGDALAHQFGLPQAMIATGIVFISLCIWFYSIRTDNRVKTGKLTANDNLAER
jgi:uncharacterized membrane-anchored protein